MLKPASQIARQDLFVKFKRVFSSAVIAGFLATSIATMSQAQHQDDLDNDNIVKIIERGQLTQIERLFENGLDINRELKGDGTPLIIAVRSGNLALVEYLLSKGADVNVKTEQDASALIVAASSNNLEMVAYLHEQGAEIDAITEYDETALISASRAGHFQVVKYLVERGADVNLAVEAKVLLGTEWRSPLRSAKTPEIREFLKAHGAKV